MFCASKSPYFDCLQQGAFDTLRRGDLSGLQVCVHPDAKRRNRTIETYTFTIQYATGNDGQLLPTGVSLAEYDDEKIVNVDNVGEDLQNTLETITALCEGIPELPSMFVRNLMARL